MVKERMDLLELMRKRGVDGDVDFLREALRVLVEEIWRLMCLSLHSETIRTVMLECPRFSMTEPPLVEQTCRISKWGFGIISPTAR